MKKNCQLEADDKVIEENFSWPHDQALNLNEANLQ